MNINEEIQKCENKVEKMKMKLAIEEGILHRLRAIQGPNGKIKKRRDGSLIKGIETVLRESEGPTTIPIITQQLKNRGVTSSSKHGLGPMVASALRKDDKTFVRVSRGLYDLKERVNGENREFIETE